LKIKGATAGLTIIILLTGFMMTRCAKQGSPTGGPKDTDPPEFLSSIPPNRSIFFKETKATIVFSEFIQLKDPSKEIFISPPQRTKPEYKTQGKKVIVEFQEELRPNTTYTLSFGNSVIDFTEGNPLVNFEYVFSTGNHIDSLSIPGKILDALDHKPVPDIIVMVYQDDNDTIPLDSLPLRVRPKNASKTTKEGTFRINNLASGDYKLFAIEDLNNNFIFDLPNERIAFLDSLVTIIPPLETMSIPVDSTSSDTLAETTYQDLTGDSYTLYLFQEVDSVQKLLSKKLIGNNLLQYIFHLPADSVQLAPVNFQPLTDNWYLTEFGTLRDTVNFWLKQGLPDTIRVCVSAADSIADTARYIISQAITEKPGKRKEAAKSGFILSANIVAGGLDYYKTLQISFSSPVQDFDSSRIILNTPSDTIVPVFRFLDTLQRRGEIGYPWIPPNAYQLIINDSAFFNLSGIPNDSISFRFRLKSMEDYGLLLLNVLLPDSVNGQFIIQLMNDKGTVIRQSTINKPDELRFEYLMPGNYSLKAIHDSNQNGKWDTGNYRSNILPERVEYYTPALVIRANWDLQEDWQLR
jgi:uncharacterized protein (DUF2141 family)